MTAEEIRIVAKALTEVVPSNTARFTQLSAAATFEIAAQLAELNQQIRQLIDDAGSRLQVDITGGSGSCG